MNEREHLLVLLMEEASEVIKATSKALRFGLLDSYPDYADGKPNWRVIREELHDLVGVVEMLNDDVCDLLPFDRDLIEAKKCKVLKFIKHARANGAIS